MTTNVHSAGELGRILMYLAGIVVFVVVALTWVPDWIAPEGTTGTGNRGAIGTEGVGKTVKMIQ